MSNTWYYADGESTRGPMSLADLTSSLSRAPDPASVLVWRSGFETWRPAGDVEDVATSLFKPRSLRADSATAAIAPSAIIQPASQTHAADPANIEPSSKPAPSGIGGWLILMAIGQVLGPLRFFASAGQYYSSLSANAFRQFPLTFWGEAAMNVGLAILYVYTATLFFRKSERFLRFFVYEVVATAMVFVLSEIWVASSIMLLLVRAIS